MEKNENLSIVWIRDSQSLMMRISASMQTEIAQDNTLENRSYCGLILRLSEPDLVREFVAAMNEAVASKAVDEFSCEFTFSLSPVDFADSTANDFASSTTLYKQLCATPGGGLARSVSLFTRDFFLNPLVNAFNRARIDSAEVKKMMPFARRALNLELLQFYQLIACENGIGLAEITMSKYLVKLPS